MKKKYLLLLLGMSLAALIGIRNLRASMLGTNLVVNVVSLASLDNQTAPPLPGAPQVVHDPLTEPLPVVAYGVTSSGEAATLSGGGSSQSYASISIAIVPPLDGVTKTEPIGLKANQLSVDLL